MQDQAKIPTEKPEETRKPDFKAKLKQYWQKRWIKWTVIGISVFIVLWCAFGIFLLPGIIKSKAQAFVEETFHRTVDFKEISFNPLTLTVKMDGLHLSEPNSEKDFISFEALEINVSSESIFRLAPVVEEIKLSKPVIHIIRTGKNHYNFDDFIAFALKPEKDKQPTYFSINNIQIEEGSISFDDQPKGKIHQIDAFNLSIPFISNIPSKVDIFVDLAMSANIDHKKFEFDGKARAFSKDKDGQVRIKLEGIDLRAYMEYLPFKLNFILKDGRINVDAQIGFVKPEVDAMQLTVAGDFSLESLQIAELNGKNAIHFPRFSVTLDKSDILSGNINIADIHLVQPEINMNRNIKGEWNLEQMAKLVPITDANSGYSPEMPDHLATDEVAVTDETTLESDNHSSSRSAMISLKKLLIEDGSIRINDDLKQIPADFSVQNLGLQIDDTKVDLGAKHASVVQVVSEGTHIQFAMKNAPGNIQHQTRAAVQRTAKEASSLFGFLIEQVHLKDWTVTSRNILVGKPVTTQFAHLNVDVENVSSEANSAAQVVVTADVNNRGALDVRGTVFIAPLKADLALDIKDVDITMVQPFINDKVNLTLQRADLSLHGKAKVAKTNEGLNGTFVGNAALSHLVSLDQLTREPFVDWGVMKFNGIKATLNPLKVVADQVLLDKLSARVILRSNGVLNIHDILRNQAGGRKSLTRANDDGIDFGKADSDLNSTEDKVNKVPLISADNESNNINGDFASTGVVSESKKPAYSLAVKKFILTNSRVRFTDNFIRPHYTANLLNLNGKVVNISTDPDTQSSVEVHGKVNGAPLNISGTANLLSQKLALDLKASVKGMELSQFSSYSGKYIGYGIEKGKLSFNVAYTIQDRKLSAENQLILDQLTLGQEVKSDDAIHLPVRLALALLKDRHGVIDLNLPVGGSLDDPQFSVGGIIVKVIVNVLTKAVTAPFNLLASLVGGGEELSRVPFDPGVAVISDREAKILTSLTNALNERPALQLEITGKYDPEVDAIGLGKQRILQKIRRMKRKELGLSDTDKVTISEAEYADKLKQLYKKEKFDKPTNWIGFNKSLPTGEMELLLSKHYAKTVTADELLRLATRRALAVKEWLLEQGKIPDERMFVLQSKQDKSVDGVSANRVDFSLR